MKCLTFFTTAVAALSSVVSAANYTNPLRAENGADPFIVYDDGYYYFLTTTWADLQITRAKTLGGLATGERKTVWGTAESKAAYNTWAPEIHKLDGTWYMYFSQSNEFVPEVSNQGLHALQGGASPWDDYEYMGQISADNNWSIDGTIIDINDKKYTVYSCIVSTTGSNNTQHLCITEMLTPLTFGPIGIISAPTLSWEQQGVPVNEGPEPLYSGDRTFITYSASYCWTDGYKLGLLEYLGGDPLEITSWKKYADPVFKTANSNYGPGHNSNFLSPDGTEWWNVYHATSVPEGACDGRRYTMAQKINFDSTGFPQFGIPLAFGELPTGPSGEPSS